MDDSTFLIVGANGQLGQALQAKYPQAQTMSATELDITDFSVLESFNWQPITTVVNAAGFTNVDGAETAEGRLAAWAVNATGAANLAKIAAARNITLVHISTDYVFDGTQDMHTESEAFSPLSVYGASKAAGDIAVALHTNHYILRTSWVIGEGKNFVRTMLGLGQKSISPTVVADQVGRLTFTSELVKAIDHLLVTKAAFGTYNVSNAGDPISWADITRVIFEEAGFMQLSVADTTTAEYFVGKEGVAPRPLKSTLDLSKIQNTGFTSTDWRVDLKTYVAKELAQ